nr:uncharacterized protein LOC110360920 [Columba livia]
MEVDWLCPLSMKEKQRITEMLQHYQAGNRPEGPEGCITTSSDGEDYPASALVSECSRCQWFDLWVLQCSNHCLHLGTCRFRAFLRCAGAVRRGLWRSQLKRGRSQRDVTPEGHNLCSPPPASTTDPHGLGSQLPGMYQTHSRLTSAIGVNRLGEAINSTGYLSLDHFFHSVDCEAAGILGSTPPKQQHSTMGPVSEEPSLLPVKLWTEDGEALERASGLHLLSCYPTIEGPGEVTAMLHIQGVEMLGLFMAKSIRSAWGNSTMWLRIMEFTSSLCQHCWIHPKPAGGFPRPTAYYIVL